VTGVEEVSRAADLARAGRLRTAQLLEALGRLDDDAMMAPSELPGWSRLTIVCHLRYGASALLRMTRDALAGRALEGSWLLAATDGPRGLVTVDGERVASGPPDPGVEPRLGTCRSYRRR
jgi:hypothetical protein